MCAFFATFNPMVYNTRYTTILMPTFRITGRLLTEPSRSLGINTFFSRAGNQITSIPYFANNRVDTGCKSNTSLVVVNCLYLLVQVRITLYPGAQQRNMARWRTLVVACPRLRRQCPPIRSKIHRCRKTAVPRLPVPKPTRPLQHGVCGREFAERKAKGVGHQQLGYAATCRTSLQSVEGSC